MKTHRLVLFLVLLGALCSLPSLGQWVQTGPFGQLSFRSLASSGPLVFAGGNAGLYRSSNSGQ